MRCAEGVEEVKIPGQTALLIETKKGPGPRNSALALAAGERWLHRAGNSKEEAKGRRSLDCLFSRCHSARFLVFVFFSLGVVNTGGCKHWE